MPCVSMFFQPKPQASFFLSQESRLRESRGMCETVLPGMLITNVRRKSSQVPVHTEVKLRRSFSAVAAGYMDRRRRDIC